MASSFSLISPAQLSLSHEQLSYRPQIGIIHVIGCLRFGFRLIPLSELVAMARVRVGHRVDPFIQQDPNNSRYSKRLSDEEWDYLKPKVSELFYQGVSTAEILRQLPINFYNVHVTRNQLDNQMRKWYLIKRRQRDYVITPNDRVTAEQLTVLEHCDSSLVSADYSRDGEAMPTSGTVRKLEGSYPSWFLPTYRFRTAVQDLAIPSAEDPSQYARSRPKTFMPPNFLGALSALAHAALLLTDMRCYSEAFEVWFLVISSLYRSIPYSSLWSTQLMFLATTCARSAFTDEQKLVAIFLLDQVCDWRVSQSDPGSIAYQPLEHELGSRAQSIHDWAQSLLVQRQHESEHWVISHYCSFSVAGPAYYALLDAKELSSKNLRDWPSDLLNSFFGSPDVQQLLLEAVKKIRLLVSSESIAINQQLKRSWPHIRSTSCDFAQALACLLLEYERADHSPYDPFPSLKRIFADSDDIFVHLKRQALVILPFVVVHWIPQSDTQSNSISTQEYDWPCSSDGLEFALQRVTGALHRPCATGKVDSVYGDFIAVYIEQLRDCTLGDHTPGLKSTHRLVSAVVAMAENTLTSEIQQPQTVPRAIDDPDKTRPESTYQAARYPQDQNQQAKQYSVPPSVVGPPLSRSYASSLSSGYRSLKRLSTRIRANVSRSNASVRTSSTGLWPDSMSWASDSLIGFDAIPSLRNSTVDVDMDDVSYEVDGAEAESDLSHQAPPEFSSQRVLMQTASSSETVIASLSGMDPMIATDHIKDDGLLGSLKTGSGIVSVVSDPEISLIQ